LRKVGLELELLQVAGGRPLEWGEWRRLVELKLHRLGEVIRDSYTGEPLGVRAHEGVVGLDSNAGLLELSMEPRRSLDDLLDATEHLYREYLELAAGAGIRVVWTSQLAPPPGTGEYRRRVARRGIYGVLWRRWDHRQLMNSAAMQPAIDVGVEEAGCCMLVLAAFTPYLISRFEDNYMWRLPGVYATRLELWCRMVPREEHFRLGLPEFDGSTTGYLREAIWRMKPFLIPLKGKYKYGRVGLPASDTTVGELYQKGSPIRVLEKVDFSRLEATFREASSYRPSPEHIDVVGMSFHDAKLRLKLPSSVELRSLRDLEQAVKQAEKRYIEVRLLGTPKGFKELEERYELVLQLCEHAEELAPLARQLTWREIRENRRLAALRGEVTARYRRAAASMLKQLRR